MTDREVKKCNEMCHALHVEGAWPPSPSQGKPPSPSQGNNIQCKALEGHIGVEALSQNGSWTKRRCPYSDVSST